MRWEEVWMDKWKDKKEEKGEWSNGWILCILVTLLVTQTSGKLLQNIYSYIIIDINVKKKKTQGGQYNKIC